MKKNATRQKPRKPSTKRKQAPRSNAPRANGARTSTRGSRMTARRFFSLRGQIGDKATRKPTPLEASSIFIRSVLTPASSIQDTEEGGLTFTSCIATDAPVEMEARVNGRWIRFMEILDKDGLNLERGDVIGMYLDHRMWDTEKVVGRWTNFRWVQEDGVWKLLADGFVSSAKSLEDVRTKIKEGVIQSTSIGYDVSLYTDESPPFDPDSDAEEVTVLRAVDYTAIEASLTAAPADHRAIFRGAIVNEGGTDMAGRKNSKNKAPARTKNQSAAPQSNSGRGAQIVDDEDEDILDDFEDENDDLFLEDDDDAGDDGDEGDEDEGNDDEGGSRSRGRGRSQGRSNTSVTDDARLVNDCRNANIPVGFLGRYAGRRETPGILEVIADFQKARSRRSPNTPLAKDFEPGAQDRGGRYRAIVMNAARTFSGGRVAGDNEIGAELPNMTPAEMFRQVCRAHGVRYPESATEYFDFLRRDVPPSAKEAFLKIMEDTSNVIAAGPREGNSPLYFEQIALRVTANGYNALIGRSQAEWDAFEEHQAGEEVPSSTPELFDTNARLRRFNHRYTIPATVFETVGEDVFDYVNGINKAARKGFRKHAGRKIKMNPVMNDGIRFFHASRGNIGQNMPLSIPNIAVARVAMRGEETDESPSILAVPSVMYAKAVQLTKELLTTSRDDIMPFKLDVVEIPSLPADSWMLMHDKDEIAAFLDVRKTGENGGAIIEIERSLQFDAMQMLGHASFEFAHNNPRAAYLAYTGAAPAELQIEGIGTYDTLYGL